MANAAEEAQLAQAAATAGLDLLFVKNATLGGFVHPDPTAKTASDIDALIAPCPARRHAARTWLERWLAGDRENLWRNRARGTAVEFHTGESSDMIPGIGIPHRASSADVG